MGGPSLQYSILCLGVDEEKGPPSLLHVFQALPVREIPFRFPEGAGFFVVNGWFGGSGGFRQRTRILAPLEGDPVADSGLLAVAAEDAHATCMVVQFVEGMTVPAEGHYRVEVLLEEEVVSSYGFTVQRVP